jgi:uncharacterized Zn-binding protein involved in type VI secretion
MPGVSRKTVDFAGGAISSGSSNVFIDGYSAVRVGDSVTPHGLPPHDSPVMAQGSSTVFVNGIKLCRAGDLATCGHAASGSSDVFAG